MNTEPELLNERLDRLATVLDEIMPNCELLVRDAIELLKEQEVAEPITSYGTFRCGNCRIDTTVVMDEDVKIIFAVNVKRL